MSTPEQRAASAQPTLAEVLAERARSRPSEPATACGGHRSTYAELGERVARLATVLESSGVGQGTRVMWLGRNCHRLLETMLASSQLGAVFCAANWRSSPAELEFLLRDATPAVAIWEEEAIGPAVREARDLAADLPCTWIQHDAAERGYEALLEAAAPRPWVVGGTSSDPVVLMYTAAFEGTPNGALLTSDGLLAHCSVMRLAHAVSHETVCLNSSPLFHIGGLYHLVMTFEAGGCNVFVPQADPELICAAVDRERCTLTYMFEPTVEKILELGLPSRYGLSSLRMRSFGPAWDALVTPDESPRGRQPSAYGQTELCGLVTLACLGGTGAHGRPIPPAQVRIVDEDGTEVPAGELGELVVRGATVMAGYLNRPELNARRFRDGWYRTNDLALREADGSITWKGLKGRLIKSGKENIYPQQVEACLRDHPAVEECAVIGVPDPRFEQSVKAIVVLRPGTEAVEDELIEHCRGRLASYKKPRAIVFADSLPRNGAGIDYAAVDLAYGGGGYPGSN